MERKIIIVLLQLMIVLGMSGCKKEQVLVDDYGASTKRALKQNAEGKIILGEKIENAYSVENMRKAYESLKKQGKIKPVLSEEIDIKANCLYVRFLPQNRADLNVLWSDTTLELFDYPLDYEIKEEGCYYRDPNIPEGLPTWQYTVVPVDYAFSGMKYEIIEECFIPDEDGEKSKLQGSDYENLLAAIEYESIRLTGNLTEEKKLCRSEERRVGKECRSRWSPYH